MAHLDVTVFTVYDLAVGLLTVVGVGVLLYGQRATLRYRRFLHFLVAGFLLFALGGPLTGLLAPDWVHLVHGVSALLVVFGLYDPVHNELRDQEWMQLLFREPGELRHPREWMRPLDERVLETLHASGLTLTPAIVAYNIGYSPEEVNRRLSTLTDHDFVERVERGKYRITDVGELFLQGQPTTETE